jgi:hypothetical protein
MILPKIAFAQEMVTSAATLVYRINKVIINPLIIFIFALALAYFLWGVIEFVLNASDDDKRTTGKRHMLWGLVGMFIMISVFTIMQIIINTLGIDLGTATPSGGPVQVR